MSTEKERCQSCGAALYPTDAVCMSCGAARFRAATPPPLAAPARDAGRDLALSAEAAPPVGVDPGPRPRWGEFSSYVVERLGTAWGPLGWLFFLGWFIGPLFAPGARGAMPVWWTLGGLTVLWWNLDVNDQQVSGWQIALGLVMLAIGFLPRGGFLVLACWVLYWTKVRE